ncbi:YcjX family protein [Kangiella sp.]|uniref:YcjX family protein n=1 Tax=Kangiella sp. TaxID=1920245 RepID=UPI00198D2ED7|nr:YcjX family protein [Kangiella sp.]MBD3654431.1 YcjX family protein [Kangiella sp.]
MSEKSSLSRLVHKAEQLIERGIDKRVRIAVTGLSGAGKTAFITSFMNQLLHIADNDQLPFLRAAKEGRVLASKVSSYDELHIPEFKYRQSLDSIIGSTPSWPASTTGISQAQLNVRYIIKNEWLQKLQKQSHLTIDIIDYPGEWLLDLPLLRLSYKEWSVQCLQLLEQSHVAEDSDWREQSTKVIYQQPLADESIAELSLQYKDFIKEHFIQQQTYNLLQPGRFILPGELQGAPVLDFFPVLDIDILNSDWSALAEDSLIKTLEKRFNYYKQQIVQPFFKEYFEKVDRQILLVDCLEVLNGGYQNFRDMQFTLVELLKSFHYGQSNWLKRMFNPSIDKLLIAATKADHVPPEQHRALEGFLQNMLQEAKNDIQYEGIELETMAISAIKVTEAVIAEHQGQKLMCVKGIELDSGEEVINYPGRIQPQALSRDAWREHQYDFINFAIPTNLTNGILPHIRMDKVMQFLIGDKFR